MNSSNELTSFAGLPLYLELAMTTGLCAAIANKMKTKSQGWTDQQIILSLVLLNLAGGDCVDDIDRLEKDEGLSRLLLKIAMHGMKRKKRREHERRWRKSNQRSVPSPSAIRRYLEQFHNSPEEELRVEGKILIPSKNIFLETLTSLNSTLVEFTQERSPSTVATLDQDATLVPTNKTSALYCYKKFKAYQPFNTYWHEQGLLLSSEFRDGNVNAGHEQLRILKEDLEKLPPGIDAIRLRSDSAGYQKELLKYCAEGKNERFGVIEFAISARVSSDFKLAVNTVDSEDWQPIFKEGKDGKKIKTEQEWAEVCFVPNWVGHKKSNPEYRYIAIREKLILQQELDLEELSQLQLPFQTIKLNEKNYKLFGIITNRTIPGNDLIHWHRERCGDSEKVHSVEKSELAGGQLPSNLFGANAAWWQIMLLTFNLNILMKRFALPENLKTKSLKGLRFQLIQVAGQVVRHARGLMIKLSGGKAVTEMICKIRQRIYELGWDPPAASTA